MAIRPLIIRRGANQHARMPFDEFCAIQRQRIESGLSDASTRLRRVYLTETTGTAVIEVRGRWHPAAQPKAWR